MTQPYAIERSRLRIEEARLELEREKVVADRERLELARATWELERQKVEIERAKAQWTGPTVLATVVAAALVLLGGVASQYLQAKSQLRLKASELVLSAQSASQAKANAIALQRLFVNELPPDFATRFPDDIDAFGPDIISAKVELLKIMHKEESEAKKQQIQQFWMKLFPEDTTFRR